MKPTREQSPYPKQCLNKVFTWFFVIFQKEFRQNKVIAFQTIMFLALAHFFGFWHRFKSLLEKGEIGLHFLFSNRNTKKSQTGFQSGKRLFMFAAQIA
ncbi:MAG: hypothetical protein AB1797_12830 [bacterium]